MGEVNLYHPVTEEKAAEFVDATYVPDDGLDSDQVEAQRKQRVADLQASAAANAAWRESRSADEQIKLSSVPFASSPDKDDPEFTGEVHDDES